MTERLRQNRIQFLDGFPQTREQRAQARNITRSHAANSRWRAQAKQGDGDDPPRAIVKRLKPSSREYTNSAAYTTDVTSYRMSWCEQTPLQTSLQQSLSTISRPPTLPAQLQSIAGLPDQDMRQILHQIYVRLDQVFVPGLVSGYNSTATMLMQKVIAEPLSTLTFTFSQLVRNMATKFKVTPMHERALSRCIVDLIRLVNRRISDPATATDDDTILAVLALTFHNVYPNEQKKPADSTHSQGPNQGPLKSLRMLQLYGGPITHAPVHLRGLAKMVELRGGLKNLALPGLAQNVAYGDLILASRQLHRPQLPFLASFEIDLDLELQILQRPDHPLRELGRGFAALNILPNADGLGSVNLESLTIALGRLSSYTLAVDDYLAARLEAQNLTLLGEERNFVHHSLMCLTPTMDTDQPRPYDVLELCQMTALIYSFLCVFPIPSAPFQRLSSRIKTGLSHRKFAEEWDRAPRLMMWIVAMAAIACGSHDSSTRTWFLAVLDRCLRDLNIRSADGFKDAMREFLWFPSTNDQDADDLWDELRTLDPFSSDG